eukprot:TRINITY_DN20417_c0_g1_i1.p1 TRINITY_DN20417_c0_g1~~TRINITY_DN20417_c0_g1_i1.p1  ORF type:complete len:382 (-),score=34.96 TRINITY_DN20417_c0_g1_i1:192-1307(-)
MLPFFRIITDEGIDRLRERKFVNFASTPIDTLLDPFWTFLARQMPRSLSPNAISLIGCVAGMLSAVLAVLATWYQNPAFHLLAGCGILMYMNADAIDGKHARMTSQATPLGILVDHGIDAFVAFTSGVAVCVVVEPTLSTVNIMAGYCAFHTAWFCAQWRELETGSLDTRGVTEGEIGTAAAISLPAIVGLDFYGRVLELPVIGQKTFGNVLEYLVFFGCAALSLSHIAFVVVARGGLPRHMGPLLHMALHNTVALALATTSAPRQWPLTCFLLVGMNCCVLLTKIRIVATTGCPWPALHLDSLPYFVVAGAEIVLGNGSTSFFGFKTFIGVLFWQIVVLTLIWYDSVSRICRVLQLPFLGQVHQKTEKTG